MRVGGTLLGNRESENLAGRSRTDEDTGMHRNARCITGGGRTGRGSSEAGGSVHREKGRGGALLSTGAREKQKQKGCRPMQRWRLEVLA